MTPTDIVAAYKAGTKLNDLARLARRGNRVVRKILTDAGITIRSRGGEKRNRKAATDVWSLISRRDANECWPYGGRSSTSGYGQMSVSGRRRPAHVIAYETVNGPMPNGYVVDHKCHNADPNCHGGICPHRMCCNPTHLEAVTGSENVRRSPHHPGNTQAKIDKQIAGLILEGATP